MTNLRAVHASKSSASSKAADRRVVRGPNGRVRTVEMEVPNLDRKAHAAELSVALDGEVRFDDGSRRSTRRTRRITGRSRSVW